MSLPQPSSSVDIESLLLRTIESSEIADTFPWSALIGVDHSLAGFRDKRNREARDEDLLANMKVRNKTFAQIAAYGNSL